MNQMLLGLIIITFIAALASNQRQGRKRYDALRQKAELDRKSVV